MFGDFTFASSIIGEETRDLEKHAVPEYEWLRGIDGYGENSIFGHIGMLIKSVNIDGCVIGTNSGVNGSGVNIMHGEDTTNVLKAGVIQD